MSHSSLDVMSGIYNDWLREHEQAQPKQVKVKKFHCVFDEEISSLMYVNGDLKEPLPASVAAVRMYLREQLNEILLRSAKLAEIRKEKQLKHEHFLFLMRNNKVKLQRLLSYLNLKDCRDVIGKNYKNSEVLLNKNYMGKRAQACLKFLHEMFPKSVVDDLIHEKLPDGDLRRRLERQDSLVTNMTNDDYQFFSIQKKTSFLPSGETEKFKRWLMLDKVTSLQPTNVFLDIINYLARETITEIVDMALLLRENKKMSIRQRNPLSEKLEKLLQNSPQEIKLQYNSLFSTSSQLFLCQKNGHSEESAFPKSHSSLNFNKSSSDPFNILFPQKPIICIPLKPEEIEDAVKRLKYDCNPFKFYECESSRSDSNLKPRLFSCE